MSTDVERKKSKRLTLDERLELLQRLEGGESCTSLADHFGITKSAVTWIKKSKENVLHQKRTIDDAGGFSNKKRRYSGVEESELEKYLYQWFIQKNSIGEPVSGPLLQEKALFFNRQLNGSTSFKASDGFLYRFKKRHGIGNLSIKHEKLSIKDEKSVDKEASDTFCEEFSEFLTENGYAMDMVYNADESGLHWKMIPSKTLATSAEKTASGRKLARDRVTLMVCANASGTHKLPLMVVGKSQKPKCFTTGKIIPVDYRSEKSGWMNRKLTMQWYTEVFLPEIERFHGPNAKCVLLLDNAPCHPPAEQFNAISDMCIVKYLPPNGTPLIQPMDQGIIETLKKVYKKNLLSLALTENSFESVEKLLSSLNILQCCNFVASAWKDVTETNVRNAWRNLFPIGCGFELVDYDLQPEVFFDLASRIPGNEGITIQDTNQWLQTDNDSGWRIMTDEEILSEAYLEESEDCDADIDDEMLPEPTAKDALRNVDNLTLWCQSRWDCKPECLDVLQSLRNSIIEQIVSVKMFSMDPL